MANKKQQRMAIRYTENIAMLYLLHYVPALPSSNIITDIQFKQPGYSLPFTEERRLTGVLAFLAHIKDDPDHIPAVCLQEMPKQHSMNILLAVNKGSPKDGIAYLSTIKRGFEQIAAKLSGVEDRAQDIERDIFAIIMELCKDRIICRLRLAKKTRDPANRTRMSIIDVLRKVIDYLSNSNNASMNTKLFLSKARNVLTLVTSWEKHQKVPELGEVVQAINSLRHTEKAREIVESIPNRLVDPGTRSHLVNMICKVSRYRESARILFLAARKFPLVREMQVVLVELPNDAFDRPTPSQDYHPTIQTTISRAPNLSKSERDVKQMCSLLKISAERAETEYDMRVRTTLKSSKIHAEILLLYYCQIASVHGQLRLPRVICSSKSACWLCNAFIQHHGKIHTPRSHGRLYAGWRLPNLHGGWFNDIVSTFNQRLEKEMAGSLKTLHRRRGKTKYPDPIESTVSTITWLSMQSNDHEQLNNVDVNNGLEESNPVLVHDVIKLVGVTTESQSGRNLEEMSAKDMVLKDCASSDSPPSESSASAMISSVPGHSNTSSRDMSHGSQENTRIYRVTLGDVTPVYLLGPLQLQFEYVGGGQQPTQGDNPPKQLLCTAEWLSYEEFQHLGLEAGVVIDAGSLTSEEVSYSTDAANNIYLSVEEAVLKLTMQPISSAADTSSQGQEDPEARGKPGSCATKGSATVSALGCP
ncbi:hypothetical protein F4859DRAFT_525622 [Xylaria cf. heliscus]|nr:hypothetical protein F4859DRAFT_525622 [Xylaria cf. heliscus]